MEISSRIKLVVFVPEPFAQKVRDAIGESGGGRIGNYNNCTFSTKGIGRFKPEEGANPVQGEVGKLEEVAEEKIESVVDRKDLKKVLDAVMQAHPYEEPAIDIYPIEEINR